MELWALDQFNQIGRITTATRVELVERDLGVGGWVVEMPVGNAGDIGAGLLTATWPGIELFDPDTGWRFGGYLTAWSIVVDDDGIETLRLVGSDFQTDLAAWREWPDHTDVEQWWAVVVGGTIPRTTDLHNTVAANAGAGIPSSGGLGVDRPPIFGLVHGPDPAGGAPLARRLKGEPLIEVAKALLWGTAWTARLRLQRSTTGAPSMLFETPARPLASIVLDVKRGTFGRLELTLSAAEATWVIGMGAEIEPPPEPGARHVARSTRPESDWRERHRELFVNRPATDDFEALAAEVNTLMAAPETKSGWAARVDSARVEGYGRDIDLGWLVDVHLGTGFSPTTVRLPVVASSLTFTPAAGWVRTVDVGTESLSGPAAIYASIARTRNTVRQIENDLR